MIQSDIEPMEPTTAPSNNDEPDDAIAMAMSAGDVNRAVDNSHPNPLHHPLFE